MKVAGGVDMCPQEVGLLFLGGVDMSPHEVNNQVSPKTRFPKKPGVPKPGILAPGFSVNTDLMWGHVNTSQEEQPHLLRAHVNATCNLHSCTCYLHLPLPFLDL
jgi:hypothetical protein